MEPNFGSADQRGVSDEFKQSLRRLRRRWRVRRVLEALVIALGLIVSTMLVGLFLMDRWRFAPDLVASIRVAIYLVAAASVTLLVLPRVLRRISDRRVAAYAEASDPGLDAMVLSAVEAATAAGPAVDGGNSPILTSRLLQRTADRLQQNGPIDSDEHGRIRRAVLLCALIGGVCTVVLLLGPAGFRHGFNLLWFPPADAAAAANPYRIQLAPGDASVVQSSDQLIVATTYGFDARQLELFTRADGDPQWRRSRMAPGMEPAQFESFLFNLDRPTNYYVTGGGVESPRYRLEILPMPTLNRIDLLYQYPRRSRRPPELISGGGDIRAVRGTRVEVRVIPNQRVGDGRLLINGELPVVLNERDGALVAELVIERDGHYRVELPAGDGRLLPASREYAVEALVDTMPDADIVRPGRDVNVTSVEEIELEVRAHDDVAVTELELVLSFNGAADEILPLAPQSPSPDLRTRYMLYLEDRELEPGDLIAYYARARDAEDSPERAVTTDIYFMEVRPFDRNFRRARGGGAGGGEQGSNDALAAQQRQLVIALFKLQRDRAAFTDSGFSEHLDALTKAQARIRDRVDAILRRLTSRNIQELGPALQRLGVELPKASAAMLRVEALLAARDTGQALPQARAALLYLQRADAAFREVQIALGSRGGGGGSSSANDLANLFRLEMDKFRSQYEHVQRGQWEAPEKGMEDTLRRLRELARRQQQEMARAERRDAAGKGNYDSQRDLADRVDEVLRQLERLTRERPNERLRRAQQAAREAAGAMRRGGVEQARIALQRLREAQRALDDDRSGGLVRGIDEALQQANSLSESQGEIQHSLESTPGGRRSDVTVAEALDRKREMARDTRRLDARLDQLARDAESDESGVSQSLRDARRTLRAGDLVERIERSRRMLSHDSAARTGDLEAAIESALEHTRDRIKSARSRAIGGDAQARTRSLEALRSLVNSQHNLQEQLRAQVPGLPGTTGHTGGPAPSGRGDLSGAASSGRADDGAGGRLGGGTMADVRRRFVEDGRRLHDLSTDLQSLPSGHAGDIDAVINGLLSLGDSSGDAADLAAGHALLLAELKEIERGLRREQPDKDPALVAGERAEPGDAYRDLVDEYYRRLSEVGGETQDALK